jgi:hypothetical protein
MQKSKYGGVNKWFEDSKVMMHSSVVSNKKTAYLVGFVHGIVLVKSY